jgi:hemoglobin/transferrin/lactoferrin receptor protein
MINQKICSSPSSWLLGNDRSIGSLFFVIALLLVGCCFRTTVYCQSIQTQIRVTDESGANVMGATLTVLSAQGSPLSENTAASNGLYSIRDLPQGGYLLLVEAAGFQPVRTRLLVAGGDPSPIHITLSPAVLKSEITSTSRRGEIEEIDRAAELVSVVDVNSAGGRPLPSLGHAIENAPGVLMQQTTYGQVSPFLRGLTGYQVLNMIDGVRFNNSTFRSGPNQYLALVEPSQAQRVEALLGPSGAQYGSDGLGGAIHLITDSPRLSQRRPAEFSGEMQVLAASADASGGGNLKFTVGTPRVAFLLGGAWTRRNDLRAGGGEDSHHVFQRFFGLDGGRVRDIVGDRQQDTGFAQHGWQAKVAARPAEDQTLTLRYQQGSLDRVRGYKDLWGGLGRLRSDFEPQELQFFYLRYEKLKLAWLDSLTGAFSINSQRDGSIRQNLSTTDRITTDDNLVNSFGYSAQATTHVGSRHLLVFGGELYRESIRASRVETDPVLQSSLQKRALYPNGSRYSTFGSFLRHSADWLQGRLRSSVSARYTRIGFRTFSNRNLTATGGSLGVAGAQESFQDTTFSASLTWRVTPAFNLHTLVGRGFRAPNLNDLGALGLNDLGYEVPASEAARFGALIGASDGENVASIGRRVGSLNAERLFNYELGASYQTKKFYARVQVFDAELKQPIVRRSLLFPADAPPQTIAGLAVLPISQTPEQRAQGVIAVATAFDPRSLKAFVNEGQSKYYGGEALFRYKASLRWSVEGNYSFLAGRELNPNRLIRRLPPQQGSFALRHDPVWLRGRIRWIELGANLAGSQQRLSGGDLTDERIGAGRRRRDISDFFRGSLVRPFLNAGSDAVFGTADDRFTPTGESLDQIRDRVLPLGAVVNGVRIVDDNSRAPLFLKTPGYASLYLRANLRLSERLELDAALTNLLDKNYRVHGSGLDAPGRNFFLRLRYSF